ncbi:DUF1622 domain-containing protein [Aquimarina intermedia]|uniref:Putative membrane protein n=1 Tax=Aquimarina intermedia TaxID=350814 RepID=A0A5S5C9A0_9FLAO|nr:DUF1622 domain-containing protein [Aquimarina intermedia]TYP75072.1 putative membrane protein [Aquimarina intermedia]
MHSYIDLIARILEFLGVLLITVGICYALLKYIFKLKDQKTRNFDTLRQDIGKSILLGLEILVGADIIATVITEPSMDKVLTLGIIILIRTLLSFSLQVELEGKFPWQKAK